MAHESQEGLAARSDGTVLQHESYERIRCVDLHGIAATNVPRENVRWSAIELEKPLCQLRRGTAGAEHVKYASPEHRHDPTDQAGIELVFSYLKLPWSDMDL